MPKPMATSSRLRATGTATMRMGSRTKRHDISWLPILRHQNVTRYPSSLRHCSCDGRRAIRYVSEPQSLHILSDAEPYHRIHEVLRDCRRWGASLSGKAIHCWLIKGGFSSDVFVANNLITMYGNFRCLDSARHIFNQMLERNVASWTSLMSCYTRFGMPQKALQLFRQMQSEHEEPNSFALASVAKACALLKDMEMGRVICDLARRHGLHYDVVLMNSILHMYVKCGSLVDARQFFYEMPVKNAVSWNTMIAGCTMEGSMEEAACLFDAMPDPNAVSWNTMIAGYASKNGCQLALECVGQMHRSGVNLDQFTFPCALEACGFLRVVTVGKQIHAYVMRSGYESSCYVVTALVDFYSQCNCVKEAHKQFTSGSNHDCPSLWNAMLTCYANSGHNYDALNLASQMHRYGLILDSFTFIGILKVCINRLDFHLGHQVHGLIVGSGFQFDVVLGGLLVGLYTGCGKVGDAWKLFLSLPDPDVVAWTGLISGCVQQGFNSLAISLFRDMVRLNVDIDHFVVSSTLKACSALATLDGGKQIHAFVIKDGCEFEAVTQAALVDMYCKCGEIEDGQVLFEGLTQKDAVCWTGMITGCARHGRAKEAILYFQRMVNSGIKPNEVTFASVLSACRHAGLTDEAWVHFRSMREKHGLTPGMEHYCCMIDLLGQAGCFEEAERLIFEMPFEPDEIIWKSLLGACKIHGNLELGNCAAKHLFAVRPHDTSAYIMLSNMHASLGMWTQSAKYKEVVKFIGKRESGSSWIEVRA